MRRFAFPKSRRLLANSQFKSVFSGRLSARDENLVLYARENGLGLARLGISLRKSCGNAVVRNRLKRLIREAFRHNQHIIPAGYDYVVTMSGRATVDSGALKLEEVQNSLLALAARLASKGA
ncbi:MAG: ribonuclease P protein component [Sedimentisphaerales bacterium]|nr:ribonuclease P protein component [Sedimentisphaerales bacterium]